MFCPHKIYITFSDGFTRLIKPLNVGDLCNCDWIFPSTKFWDWPYLKTFEMHSSNFSLCKLKWNQNMKLSLFYVIFHHYLKYVDRQVSKMLVVVLFITRFTAMDLKSCLCNMLHISALFKIFKSCGVWKFIFLIIDVVADWYLYLM